jgi:hypothetical protein
MEIINADGSPWEIIFASPRSKIFFAKICEKLQQFASQLYRMLSVC